MFSIFHLFLRFYMKYAFLLISLHVWCIPDSQCTIMSKSLLKFAKQTHNFLTFLFAFNGENYVIINLYLMLWQQKEILLWTLFVKHLCCWHFYIHMFVSVFRNLWCLHAYVIITLKEDFKSWICIVL